MKITLCNLQSSGTLQPALARMLTQALRRASCARLRKGEITLCVADERLMRELNLLYRGVDAATDCLAFDLGSRRRPLFEIVICLAVARANARTYKSSPAYEACLYAVHGCLHLCGWKDDSASERRAMQKKAERLLSRLPSVMSTLPAAGNPRKRG